MMFYAGKPLNHDDMNLFDRNIKDNSTIILVSRLTGDIGIFTNKLINNYSNMLINSSEITNFREVN